MYRNPITPEYVPVRYLWIVVIILPLLVFTLHFLLFGKRDKKEYVDAVMGFSLALPLNGVLTDTIKHIVGRPRPDFFWRCFPNGEMECSAKRMKLTLNIFLGEMNSEMECTGNPKLIAEGRKSFPSGHSSCKFHPSRTFGYVSKYLSISVSFVAMGYLSMFLFARLHVFTERGRGQSWRLIVCLAPLFGALLVALSRTCDYHHHWQDVVVGSFLGLGIAVLCYRQYFPPVNAKHMKYRTTKAPNGIGDAEAGEETKLIAEEDLKPSIKWI